MSGTLDDLGWQQAPPRRRRRGWPWLVALLVVAGLAVGAWFLGEYIARQVVTTTIRQQVIDQLALPADQQVDVEIGGAPVLPQLIAGRLDVVTISSRDVPLGPTAGDVSVRAAGVPVRGEPVLDGAQGTVTLDLDEVAALLAQTPDVTIENPRFEGTDVGVTVPFTILGATIPVDAVLSPQARDGDLVLAPVSYTVAGATFSVDDLRDRFGDAVSAITADRTVCLAGYLPAGLSLQHVQVSNDVIQAQFAVDPRIAADTTLQQPGVCS